MGLDKIYEYILEALFPRRCPVCGDLVEQDKYHSRKICPDCYERLRFIAPEESCQLCGRRIGVWESGFCRNCRERVFSFKRGLVLLDYNDDTMKSMADIKYKSRREYLDFYGEEAAKRFGEKIRSWGIDGLVPVPVHRKRKNKRGYNQAEILAKVISGELHIPVYPNALLRQKNTKAMKELSAEERKKNLKNALSPGVLPKSAKKLLIIDDIFTTGATVNACAELLREMGASEVCSLCLCAKADVE